MAGVKVSMRDYRGGATAEGIGVDVGLLTECAENIWSYGTPESRRL